MGTRRQDVEDAVLRSLEDLTGKRRDQIKLTDRLLKDLKLDGDDFSFVFVPTVEKALAIQTSPQSWRGVFTVQEAIDVFAVAPSRSSR